MKIRLIRSATLRMEYAGRRFVIDPYLAARHSRPSFAGRSPNPLVDLPCSPAEVIAGIEWALVSHLHSDHFDPAAQELLPKDTLIFCQPGDETRIIAKGFQHVTPITDQIVWRGMTMTRTPGQHGSGSVLAEMGPVSGFIFQAENEPTVYWAGDTIWYEGVADTIARTRPQIIVTHSCGAMWGAQVLIVMDAAQTVAVCQAAPGSKVIATHLDSVDHATISREALRAVAQANDIGPAQLLIPADGEELVF